MDDDVSTSKQGKEPKHQCFTDEGRGGGHRFDGDASKDFLLSVYVLGAGLYGGYEDNS